MADFGLVESFKTKTEVVYNFLKVNILNGDLKPGAKLVISRISKELNTSDIPIREAFKKLETEELIRLTPHVGASVIDISQNQFEEIFLIRCELEGLATRLASTYIKEKDFDDLAEIIKESEAVLESGRFDLLPELNKQFHLRLYAASPHKILFKMISDLWDKSQMVPRPFIHLTERRKKSINEHKEILKILRKGNGNLAAEKIKQQKLTTWKAFLNLQRESRGRATPKQNTNQVQQQQ